MLMHDYGDRDGVDQANKFFLQISGFSLIYIHVKVVKTIFTNLGKSDYIISECS